MAAQYSKLYSKMEECEIQIMLKMEMEQSIKKRNVTNH